MRSRLIGVYGGLCLIGAIACSKPATKFNFSYPHKADQLIISIHNEASRKTVENLVKEQGAELEELGPHAFLLTFPNGRELETEAEKLSLSKLVKSIEANQIYQLKERQVNDPDFGLTYGLKNPGLSGGVMGADIDVSEAWSESVGDRKVLVGIIDSGIDYRHEDLAGNIWTNPGESGSDAEGRDKASNGLDDDANGYIDDWQGWDFFNADNDPFDDNGHGTHVAGTIGAVGNNGIGIVGVNWMVSMVAAKVFSASGETSTDLIVRGIDYTSSLGVKVTNNSWGGTESSEVIQAAIGRAKDKDILFVAAAGNETNNVDLNPHYPSSYVLDNIISVASTNRMDQLSVFSNYGSTSVQVAAPGEDIYSTVPGDRYEAKSGTSMATSYVSGLVALIAARYPELSGAEIKAKILLSSVPTPALYKRVIYGRIAASHALENDRIAPAAVNGLRVESQTLREMTLSIEAAGDDGTAGEAARYQLKLSETALSDENDWAAASALPPASFDKIDGRVYLTVKNLKLNSAGFVSVRAEDNAGNLGALAPSIAFNLPSAPVLWENTSRADWLTLDTAWALRSEDSISMLSDSEAGSYRPNQSIKAELKDLEFSDSKLELSIRSRWEIEENYDFGYVEISVDEGQSWSLVETFSGVSSGWQTRLVNLEEVLGGAKRFRLRLRLETDFSFNYDGWDIDSIQIIGQQVP